LYVVEDKWARVTSSARQWPRRVCRKDNFWPWWCTINLYYKERRQLKTFLTQIGPALPLTPNPPVICFWNWIGWKDYEVSKNHNLESVSAKNVMFFSPTPHLPHLSYPRGPTFFS
jgi:hypothetical protein